MQQMTLIDPIELTQFAIGQAQHLPPSSQFV
jgi:hypothetical protein